jgi:TRAP-type C4-dicarboxylate transport system permease small subunit
MEAGKFMILPKICDEYTKWMNRIILFLGLALMTAVSIQILGRYVPFVPLWLWPQEIVNVSLVWIIFLGSIIALREKEHFTVDIFSILLKDKKIPLLTIFLSVLYYFVGFIIAAVFTYYGYFFFRDWGMIQESDITGLNLGYIYFAIPLAGVSWFLFLVESLLRDLRGESIAIKEVTL